MKKLIAAIVVVLIAPLIFSPSIFAAASLNQAEVITLTKEEVVNADYFAWGEKVTVSGTVNGDAYVAGGNVLIDGTINGDLLVVGGSVNIRGNVTNDVRVAGGQIVISGTVGGNLTSTGGSVNITDAAKINGSLTAGGGDISVFGPVAKGVTVGAGNVTIGSAIGSDITAGVGELTLTSTAKVNGNVNYWSDHDAQIQQGAEVIGATTHNVPKKEDTQKQAEEFLSRAKIGAGIVSIIMAFVIGALFLRFLPRFFETATETLTKRPLYTIFIGFLTIVLAPILFMILLISLIGIPLAFIVLVGWLFSLYLAKIFVAFAIGKKVLKSFNQKGGDYLALLVGLVIYLILSLIPVIGWIVTIIVLFAGVGALVIGKLTMYKKLRSKNLL